MPTKNGGAMAEQPQPWKRRRILFVAHQACGNPALCAEVKAHAEAPPTSMSSRRPEARLAQWTLVCLRTGRSRMSGSRRACQLSPGSLRAHSTLGDAEPVRANRWTDGPDSPADEIVICLEEPERHLTSQGCGRARMGALPGSGDGVSTSHGNRRRSRSGRPRAADSIRVALSHDPAVDTMCSPPS